MPTDAAPPGPQPDPSAQEGDAREPATPPAAAASPGPATPAPPDQRAYLRILLLAAAIGIPLSALAFGFLAGLHALENLIWEDLPDSLGRTQAAWWWSIPLLTLAGLLVALIVTRLPGTGGHVPANGLNAGATRPIDLPGVILAAAVSLPLGAVLGPEAPLIAAGSGLTLLAVGRSPVAQSPQARALLAAAGSGAAVAVIMGNPLVAVVLLVEVAAVGGPQLTALVLPVLLSTGLGALVFTGLGHWTGLDIGALSIPGLTASVPDIGDVLWTIPIAVVVALAIGLMLPMSRAVARAALARPLLATTVAGLVVGLLIAAYALITGENPAQAALSGQSYVGSVVTDPAQWPAHILIPLLLFKTLAYGVSLGSLRGGPIFPAIFIGAAFGSLIGGLPGLGVVPAAAVGMAAATVSVLRLPLSTVVLVSLLEGGAAQSQLPVIALGTVLALLTTRALDARLTARPRSG